MRKNARYTSQSREHRAQTLTCSLTKLTHYTWTPTKSKHLQADKAATITMFEPMSPSLSSVLHNGQAKVIAATHGRTLQTPFDGCIQFVKEWITATDRIRVHSYSRTNTQDGRSITRGRPATRHQQSSTFRHLVGQLLHSCLAETNLTAFAYFELEAASLQQLALNTRMVLSCLSAEQLGIQLDEGGRRSFCIVLVAWV